MLLVLLGFQYKAYTILHFPPPPSSIGQFLPILTLPGKRQLTWRRYLGREIVKRNNSFLVKEFGNGTTGARFSKEPNNLYNLNSYKHSGLANQRTVTILPGKEQSVLLAPVKTKKQKKPAALLHKSVMKKEFPRMAKAV